MLKKQVKKLFNVWKELLKKDIPYKDVFDPHHSNAYHYQFNNARDYYPQ